MGAWQQLSSRLATDSVDEAPSERSMSLGRTAMVWLAANMVVTTLLTGTLFVPGIPYRRALLVIVLGTVVGGSVLVLVGNIGTRTGLPTMVLTRGSFGRRGGYLPAIANLVVLMGWSWVQAILAGITVNYVVEQATGFSNPVAFSVLCQSLVVVLALFGHAGIERVEPWLALVMVLVAAYVFFIAFRDVGIAGYLQLPAQPELGMTAAIAFDIVVATAISWTVLSADFNRHARDQRSGIIGTAIGYTASTTISMSLGATAIAYVVLTGGEAVPFDPTVLVERFGVPLAVVIFLSVMATNTLVVYGMIMSFLNVRPRSDFLRVAVVLGLVSIAGATWLSIVDNFITFLFLISALFVPVFAIMVTDHYLLRRGRYAVADLLRDRGGAYWYAGGVNPAAILAFAVGAALAFYWTRVSPLPVGATIPTFLVTCVLYLGLALALGRGRAGARAGAGAAAERTRTR
jgi:NCS1 family nucleobase:cation symporter-1